MHSALSNEGWESGVRDDVYFVLKEGVTKENAIERLSDLARFAGYYERLLHPVREPDPDIKAAMERFNRLETNIYFPFLLNCLDDYHRSVLCKEDLTKVFKTLENFVVRRFVCNIATKYLEHHISDTLSAGQKPF